VRLTSEGWLQLAYKLCTQVILSEREERSRTSYFPYERTRRGEMTERDT
jgi:hypothetical protein